jgi:dTDP-4-amino-4,6-dideoxygalactose transaminase
MSIFNSLGSNYSFNYIFKNIFTLGTKSAHTKLEQVLSEYYKGTTTLTYKGREALELALIKSELPKGSSVGINGFTCYVVYEAVVDAGYKPIFIDVKPGSMHFGLNEIQKVHSYDKNLSAVIVQNTLGFPADMVEIETTAKKII